MNQLFDEAIWKVTQAVGSKWCVLVFALLPLFALPDAVNQYINTGSPVVLTNWLSSNWLQLVALPLLAVGQIMQGNKGEYERAAHAKANEELTADTHELVKAESADIQALLHAIRAKIQEKL